MKDIALKEVKNDKTSIIASLFITGDNKYDYIFILGILIGMMMIITSITAAVIILVKFYGTLY